MKTILTLLCLALLYGVIACGSDDTPPTEAPTGIAQHTDSAQSVPTPMSVGVAENSVTPEPTVLGVTDDEPPTEQPTSHSTYILRDHEGKGSRVDRGAALPRRSRCESKARVGQQRYPHVQRRPNTSRALGLIASQSTPRPTAAIPIGTSRTPSCSLSPMTGADADFAFTDTTEWTHWHFASSDTWNYTGNLAEGYTVGSRNPVWLPVGDTGGAFGGQSTTRSEGRLQRPVRRGHDSHGVRPNGFAPETISPQELSDAKVVAGLSGHRSNQAVE